MKQRRKPVPAKIRWLVFHRDNFTCQYCGRSAPEVALEVEHNVPVTYGGADDIDNLLTACEDCNRGKSDLTFGLNGEQLPDLRAASQRKFCGLRLAYRTRRGEYTWLGDLTPLHLATLPKQISDEWEERKRVTGNACLKEIAVMNTIRAYLLQKDIPNIGTLTQRQLEYLQSIAYERVSDLLD